MIVNSEALSMPEPEVLSGILRGLAAVELRDGSKVEAGKILRQALSHCPADPLSLRLFFRTIDGDSFPLSSEDVALLRTALADEQVNSPRVQRVAVYQVLHMLQKVDGHTGSFPSEARKLVIDLLRFGFVRSGELEKILLNVRSQMLDAVTSGIILAEEDATLAEALALHSLSVDFTWFISDHEEKKLHHLQNTICQKIANKEQVNAVEVFMLGAYRDLFDIPEIRTWIAAFAGPGLARWNDTLNLLVLDKMAEVELEKQIMSLTEIEDRTSRLFSDEYDRNPYPRWRSMEIPSSRPFTQAISESLGGYAGTFSSSIQEPRVLVAGCGTGYHPINSASKYENSQVVAVDISRRSLAYAVREANARNVKNISFAHADILQLGMMGPTFDVVEAAGVIHHMADPAMALKNLVDVLKPGGFLKLGVYSRTARQPIYDARKTISARGYSDDISGIRNLRRDFLDGQLNEIKQFETYNDFFTASGLHFMFFQGHEHVFDLIPLKEMLIAQGLEILGLMGVKAEVRAQYAAQFPEDSAQTNIENWAKFEESHPDTFRSMYNLCCRKL